MVVFNGLCIELALFCYTPILLTHLSDSPDVLLSVSGRESKVFIDALSDVVSIERVSRNALLN